MISPDINQSLEEYNQIHELRWRKSMRWLEKSIGDPPSDILEVGGICHFDQMLREKWPLANVDNTLFDVRLPESWEDAPKNHYDLILCMEVIEHLPDYVPESESLERIGTFLGTGIKQCLKGCFESLKPGGFFFLTTPNLNSIAALASLVFMSSVYVWPPHPREMSFGDAIKAIQDAGFKVMKSGTEDCYMHQKNKDETNARIQMSQMLHANQLDMSNRAETTFVIARKP